MKREVGCSGLLEFLVAGELDCSSAHLFFTS